MTFNTKIHKFLIAICLLMVFQADANTSPTAAFGHVDLITCDVPAPDNFNVDQTGTTWVNLIWDYQADALGGYRLRIYKSSTNTLIDTKIVPQNLTNVVVGGLDPDESYYGILNSRCANGEDGTQESIKPFHTQILELIVNGYQGTNDASICKINNANEKCPLSDVSSSFWIKKSNTGEFRRFEIVLTEGRVSCQIKSNESSQKFRFYCIYNTDLPNPSCNTSEVQITYKVNGVESVVANISQSIKDNTTFLQCGNVLIPGFVIEKLGPSYDTGGRGQTNFVSNTAAYAAPNPFSNSLDVYIGNLDAQKIHLQMFDLSGRAVLEQQFGGGQEQYTLPTENLSPGFYLLRVDVDGAVQTLKVVKSE